MAGSGGLGGIVSQTLAALPRTAGAALRIARVLRRLRPSIVHAHGFKMHVLAMWARPWRTPLVLHLHDYVATRRVMSRVLALRPPGPISAMAISHSVREDARRVLGAAMSIEVVHNGIDTSEWAPDGPRLDVDEAAGLAPPPPGTIRVGLVATMALWKGHEVFLRALAALPRTLPFRGYIVGGSIYDTDASQHTLGALKALAAELGLGDRLGFTGFVEEPVHAMRALDIVVHASVRPEPFGRVIIEGMATGRAVIARAHGGAAELFEPGSEAIACRSDRPAELADAIGQLVRDGSMRASLGRHGRQRVQRQFSRDGMTAAVVRIYDALLLPGA